MVDSKFTKLVWILTSGLIGNILFNLYHIFGGKNKKALRSFAKIHIYPFNISIKKLEKTEYLNSGFNSDPYVITVKDTRKISKLLWSFIVIQILLLSTFFTLIFLFLPNAKLMLNIIYKISLLYLNPVYKKVSFHE